MTNSTLPKITIIGLGKMNIVWLSIQIDLFTKSQTLSLSRQTQKPISISISFKTRHHIYDLTYVPYIPKSPNYSQINLSLPKLTYPALI